MYRQVYSDYLIFVDESGSPQMKGVIDPQFPLFVLVFIMVKKSDYIEKICPALQRFKLKHFGHDQTILHERDIRKNLGDFSFLTGSPNIKNEFLNELSDLIEQLPIYVSVIVVDKAKYQQKYHEPVDPYHLGLLFGFERMIGFLSTAHTVGRSNNRLTHVIVESRGKREDKDLEAAFMHLCETKAFQAEGHILEIIFTDKKANSLGLQLADLIARPVGISVLRGGQANRAMSIIMKKLIHKNGKIEGWGLKCFP